MKCTWPAGPLLTLLLLGATPAWGADDPRVENLALCRDSWLDWKTADPAKLASASAYFRGALTHGDNDAFGVPNTPMAVAGLKVVKVFPGSVGMGVGFSVLVDETFDVTKEALEQRLGKPLRQCETGDGMRTCELSIAAQRTVMLMSGDRPSDGTTLVGCYYLYEK
jgi:hypothetical protein